MCVFCSGAKYFWLKLWQMSDDEVVEVQTKRIHHYEQYIFYCAFHFIRFILHRVMDIQNNNIPRQTE